MTTLQQYLGRFYLGADRNSFSVGATAVTIPVGWYYLCGTTGESPTTGLLCETMQAQIRAIGATQDASTVIYDAATGRVTITLETADTLTWTDGGLGALLGDPATASGTVHAGTAQPRYLWRPSEGLVDYPGDLATWWSKSSTTLGVRAPTGATYTVEGNLLYDAKLTYEMLPLADVISASATEHVSFEQFWADVIHKGQPIRCYYDRTLATAAGIATGICLGAGEEDGIGVFTTWAQRHISTYDGLWGVELAMSKWISM